jgi:ribonuclease P protein component
MDSGHAWQQRMADESSHAAEPKDATNLLSATNQRTRDSAPGQGLGKHEVLRGYGAFKAILSNGTYVQHSGIRCFYLTTPQIPPVSNKVGFAIQGIRKASERNKLKRWMREAFRMNKQVLSNCCQTHGVEVHCVLMIAPKHMSEAASFHHFNELLPILFEKLCAKL